MMSPSQDVRLMVYYVDDEKPHDFDGGKFGKHPGLGSRLLDSVHFSNDTKYPKIRHCVWEISTHSSGDFVRKKKLKSVHSELDF